MAGARDPREEEVDPIEPDFTIPEDAGEGEALYMLTLVTLLEMFYLEFKDLPPDEVLETVDQRCDQLYDDIATVIGAMLISIGVIGAAAAIEDILWALDTTPISGGGYTTRRAEFAKQIERMIQVDLESITTEQGYTARAIVEEIRNDLRTSAYFILQRLEKEPKAQIKLGNIIKRAVDRIKRMSTYGAMGAFNQAKTDYFTTVFTIETEYEWITKMDGKVCPICMFFEENNPYTMETLPPCPYHLWCRCTYRPTTKFSFTKIIEDMIMEVFGWKAT